MNMIIYNMSKEEIVKKALEINEQLEQIRKSYEPYVGRELASISVEEAEQLNKLAALVQQLINAKAELRRTAFYKYQIFVM